MSAYTSRIGGFYRCSVPERRALLARHAAVPAETLAVLGQVGGALDVAVADRMVENVIGVHGPPLGGALHFLVNGVDYVVPMAGGAQRGGRGVQRGADDSCLRGLRGRGHARGDDGPGAV